MTGVLYQCPVGGLKVQAWVAEESPAGEDQYIALECALCMRTHLVNPTTGHVLGHYDNTPKIG